MISHLYFRLYLLLLTTVEVVEQEVKDPGEWTVLRTPAAVAIGDRLPSALTSEHQPIYGVMYEDDTDFGRRCDRPD